MLSFEAPLLLLLAPLGLLAVTAAARRSARPPARWRRAASFAARALAILLLTPAIARPGATLRTGRPFFTVFALDVSESIPRGARDKDPENVRRLWDREIAAGNRCALVTFAGRAETLVPPSSLPLRVDPWRISPHEALERLAAASERGEDIPREIAELQEWIGRLRTDSTDITAGLRAARALFSDGFENRIVLATDGRDTVRPAAEIELPRRTLAVRREGPPRHDVAVVAVEAPLAVRTGEPFDVRITVEASEPMEFTLAPALDDVPVPGMTRKFRATAAGREVCVLPNVSCPLSPGLHRLLATAEAAGDDEPRNNTGAAAITVTGRPRVLLVEGAPGDGGPIAGLLGAQDIELVREPAERPATGAGPLEEYVAVVLAGVPRRRLTAEGVRALENYVEVSGGGLWVVGSSSLQGGEGYAGSDLERILPVEFKGDAAVPGGGPPAAPEARPPAGEKGTPQRVLAPVVALLFIVDKSGSMAGNNITLVKEACIESAKTLTPKDVVGVLAFDAAPKWILEFAEADRREYIEDRVLRLYADGGTNIQPALVEALRMFQADPRARRAGVKHAVLLSDGDTQPADFDTVVRQMADAGITVTAVCVGSAPKFDALLMRRIASAGKGRFLFTNSFKNVPRIFTDETRQVLHSIPPEEKAPPSPAPAPAPGEKTGAPMRVVVRDDHEILRGIEREGLPPLHGLLGAAARAAAAVPLATPDGRPVLALQRVGLGKTAVWASDLSGRWSPDWIPWPGSGKLFAQLLRHLSSAAPDANLASRVRVTVEGGQALVRIDPGDPLTAMSVSARRPIPVIPREDGGGTLLIPPGNAGEMHRVLLQGRDGKNLLIGALRASEVEFLPPAPGHDLFEKTAAPLSWKELEKALGEARIPGERRVDLSPWLILATALLLPLDVALRRLNA